MPLIAHRRHLVASVLHVFPPLLLYQHLLCPNVLLLIARSLVQARISTPRQTHPTASIRGFTLAICSLNACAFMFHALDLMDDPGGSADGAAGGKGLLLDFIGIKTSPSPLQIYTLDILILTVQLLTVHISFLADYRTRLMPQHPDGEIEWADPLLPAGADDDTGWFFVGGNWASLNTVPGKSRKKMSLGGDQAWGDDRRIGSGSGLGPRTRRYERLRRLEEGREYRSKASGGEDGDVVDLGSPISESGARKSLYGQSHDGGEVDEVFLGYDDRQGDESSRSLLDHNDYDSDPAPSRRPENPPPPLILSITLKSFLSYTYTLPTPEPERRIFSGGTPTGTPRRGSATPGPPLGGGEAAAGRIASGGAAAALQAVTRGGPTYLGYNADGSLDEGDDLAWTPEPLVSPETGTGFLPTDAEEEEPAVRMPGTFAVGRSVGRTRSQDEVEGV